jgi:hypothetical protein
MTADDDDGSMKPTDIAESVGDTKTGDHPEVEA